MSLDLCISFIRFANFVQRLWLPSLTLGGSTVALHTPNILLLTGQLRLPKVTIFVYSTVLFVLHNWGNKSVYISKNAIYLFLKVMPPKGAAKFLYINVSLHKTSLHLS